MTQSPHCQIECGVEQLLKNEVLRRDRAVHAWPAFALVSTASLITLVLLRSLFGEQAFAGELTAAGFAWCLMGWLATFTAATVAFHRAGPEQLVTRVLKDIEQVARSLASIALLVLSGQAMLFLVLKMLGSFVWAAQPAHRYRQARRLYALSHALGIVACLLIGHFSDAMVVFLSAGTVIAVQTMTVRATRRFMRARVERDLVEQELLVNEVSHLRERIARELHDGAGSEVTALVVNLRLSAESRPDLLPLVLDAQMALEELRCAAWVLKSPETTLGGLERLLASSCHKLGGARCTQAPLRGDPNWVITPVTATTVARLARELVRCGAHATGWQRLRLKIDAEGEREVRLELDVTGGAEPKAWSTAERMAIAAGSTLRCEPQANGLRFSLEVPVLP